MPNEPDLYDVCSSIGELKGMMTAINQRIDLFMTSATKDIANLKVDMDKRNVDYDQSLDAIRSEKSAVHERLDARIEALEISTKVDRAKIYTLATTISVAIGAGWAIFTWFFK